MSLRDFWYDVPFAQGTGRMHVVLCADVFPQGISHLEYHALALYKRPTDALPSAVMTFDEKPLYWARDHAQLRAAVLQPNFVEPFVAAREALQRAGQDFHLVETGLRTYYELLSLAGTMHEQLLHRLHLDEIEWHTTADIPSAYARVLPEKSAVIPQQQVARARSA